MHLLVHYLVTLVTLLFVMQPVVQALPQCECNNGLIIQDTPSCECLCFDQYLLPHCLYRKDDIVAMELWLHSIEQPVSVAENGVCPFIASDLLAVLASRFSSDVSLFTLLSAQLIKRNAAFANSIEDNDKSVVLSVVVQMPGWAAQHLLADAVHDNLAMYQVVSHIASLDTGSTTLLVASNTLEREEEKDGTACYALFAVVEAATGPVHAPRYVDRWLRLYPSGFPGWFLSFEQWGWIIGALILFLILDDMERRHFFNQDFNVAGGAVPVARQTTKETALQRRLGRWRRGRAGRNADDTSKEELAYQELVTAAEEEEEEKGNQQEHEGYTKVSSSTRPPRPAKRPVH